ncbi:hypothetical protein L3Q67_00940 [Saccharothrix sp. AJ9571]|nr:hypothetical protein L3Q67_00940 [Saccharothrix sp. AJ9571]
MGWLAGERITAQRLQAGNILAETGVVDIAPKTATAVHATMVVPDPGVSHKLKFWGYVRAGVGTATGVDFDIIDGPGPAGTRLTTIYSHGQATWASSILRMYTVAGTSGVLAPGADRTVSLVMTKWGGGGTDGWVLSDAAFTKIYARPIPV